MLKNEMKVACANTCSSYNFIYEVGKPQYTVIWYCLSII